MYCYTATIILHVILGPVVRRDGLGKDLITGMVFGKRKRGRPKTRYKDNIKEFTNLSMCEYKGWRRIEENGDSLLWMPRLVRPMIYPYNDDDGVTILVIRYETT